MTYNTPRTTTRRQQLTNGSALKIARFRRGLGVSDVVAKLETDFHLPVSAAHLRNIESGTRNASPRLLYALAQLYKAEVDHFLLMRAET
ncbi:helix-turn-helix domain-containing protein [Saccharopolyspora mangrovi]|uniref:Helix-turn-helix transcriptional regulator n=1 Tax=Saccharopolyspora mangrovi TaxID=3082379 RepID=A0ABU6A7A5_9PSEU|nr:helix-turn-helix transcriptional regulator [Saccharopolyspora sp. S2-29]MEB3367366.1 helix-turn-helix transcriptional regulator [Saccharopolyspora sp. S2-29]